MASKKKAGAAPTEEGVLLQLDPSKIIFRADESVRFKVKPFHINNLMTQILEAGGVNDAIEVQPLTADDPDRANGYEYLGTVGEHRHTAVMKLNKEQNAGLTIPAVVKTRASKVERLKRKVSENVDRQQMSPMDHARAIKGLLEEGLSKIEIRKIFGQPKGTNRIEIKPASNSWLNQCLDFLKLPEKAQNRLDDGRITFDGGTSLVKYLEKEGLEKCNQVIDTLETNRLKQIKKDEAAEAAFLNKEKADETKSQKEQERITKENEAKAKREATLMEAKLKVEQAEKIVAERTQAVNETFVASMKTGLDKAAKNLADKAYKAANANAKAAQQSLEIATREATKAQEVINSAKELEAKKNAPKAPAAPKVEPRSGPADVEKAAKEVETGEVEEEPAVKPLGAGEMREIVKSIIHLAGTNQAVRLIGELLQKAFAREMTDASLVEALKNLIQQVKTPPPAAAAGAGKKK